jgi:hypothetical protein
MKYVFCLLLFAFCFSCEKSDPVVAGTSDDIKTYIVGYTGGWGGGPAYKLEAGQLFRSVEDRSLGSPDDILGNVEFRLMEGPDKLQAMTAVMAEYPNDVFNNVTPKFDCAETAYDGVCPYLIVVTEKGESRAWTRSEFDASSTFTDYMDELVDLLEVLRQ